MRRTHGMSGTKPYQIWKAMRRRCSYEKDKCYPNYGGRGIKVCRSWSENFIAFWDDMGGTYCEGLSIERLDTNGDYKPSNCVWADMKTQQRNRTNNAIIKSVYGDLCLAEVAERAGLCMNTVISRRMRGWADDKLHLPIAVTKSRFCEQEDIE